MHYVEVFTGTSRKELRAEQREGRRQRKRLATRTAAQRRAIGADPHDPLRPEAGRPAPFRGPSSPHRGLLKRKRARAVAA